MSSVTVIVLSWNSHAVTADCLRSVLASTGVELRVLLVDNGSTDGSPELLSAEFPGLEMIRLERNRGFTGGMNTGVERALEHGSEHILLLNNDTIVDPPAIGRLADALSQRPQAAAACPKIYFADPKDVLWFAGGQLSLWTGIGVNEGRRRPDRGEYNLPRDITFANGCVLMLRAAAVRTIGVLDERLFAYAEDTDYSFRLLAAGAAILYVPGARVWHREGFASKRNMGNPKRIYYGTRNTLLVVARHARWYHWCTFLPWFTVNWIGRFLFLSIVRWDRPALVAAELARGIGDFSRMHGGKAPRWGEPQ